MIQIKEILLDNEATLEVWITYLKLAEINLRSTKYNSEDVPVSNF